MRIVWITQNSHALLTTIEKSCLDILKRRIKMFCFIKYKDLFYYTSIYDITTLPICNGPYWCCSFSSLSSWKMLSGHPHFYTKIKRPICINSQNLKCFSFFFHDLPENRSYPFSPPLFNIVVPIFYPFIVMLFFTCALFFHIF